MVPPSRTAAVRWLWAPTGSGTSQLVAHSIPPDEATTPVPSTEMLSTAVGGGGCMVGWNVAVTVVSAVMATTHPPVPEQAPPHPAKLAFADAAAVSVTACANEPEQAVPQSMPAGEEVTLPSPETCTVSMCEAGGCLFPEPAGLPPQAARMQTRAPKRRRTRPSSMCRKPGGAASRPEVSLPEGAGEPQALEGRQAIGSTGVVDSAASSLRGGV